MRPGPGNAQILRQSSIQVVGSCRSLCRVGDWIVVERRRDWWAGARFLKGFRDGVQRRRTGWRIVENGHFLFPRGVLRAEALGQLDASAAASSGNIISW